MVNYNWAVFPEFWRINPWLSLTTLGAQFPVSFQGYNNCAKMIPSSSYEQNQIAKGWGGVWEILGNVPSNQTSWGTSGVPVLPGDEIIWTAWVWTDPSTIKTDWGTTAKNLGVSLFADIYGAGPKRIKELVPRLWCQWDSKGWIQIHQQHTIKDVYIADGALGYPVNTEVRPTEFIPIMQAITKEGNTGGDDGRGLYYGEKALSYIRNTELYIIRNDEYVPSPFPQVEPEPEPEPEPQPKPTYAARTIGPLGVPSALLHKMWIAREKVIRPEVHKKLHPLV